MSSSRSAFQCRVRCLAIGLLVLGLGHTPLPQADFHNIRHHDDLGESCRYHDHLLRWHPRAGLAEDVAVLHWHWVLPGRSDAVPEGGRPVVLAQVPDWSGLTPDALAQLVPDTCGRPLDRVERDSSMPVSAAEILAWARLPARAGPKRFSALGADRAAEIPLTTLLHRWTC